MNVKMLTTGLALMILSALFLILGPDLDAQTAVGIFLLFMIGLCLTVAGSPDPNERKNNVRPL